MSCSSSSRDGESENVQDPEELEGRVYYCDDTSSCYETTYSEDERIENCLKRKREAEREEARRMELEREQEFKEYFERNRDKPNSIFNLKGIHFIRFTSKRIKFSFQPCRVARLVSRRVMFHVSLRYRKGSWLIRRDSIPANYKLKIYNLLYTNGSFSLKDENLPYGIVEMWKILVKWAQGEDQFRRIKYARYKAGEDVYIDEDDEELFLSDSEIEELHNKREAIWNRMLPPDEGRKTRRVTRKRRRVVRASSSTSTTSRSLLDI